MKANAYLLDCFKIVGPMIDASNATDVPLCRGLTISRRSANDWDAMKAWYVYSNGCEIHFKQSNDIHTPLKAFGEFADAVAYLLSPEGQKVLEKGGYSWPLIRLPQKVQSDLPSFIKPHVCVEPGIYKPESNPLGALFLKTPGGDLGIKPDEFEWVLTGGSK